MARTLVVALGAILGLGGCISLKPLVTFESSLEVEKVPSTVSLQVTTDGTATEFDAADLRLVREGFRASLLEDLNRNGPLRVDPERPEGTLVVNLTEVSATRSLLLCWWFPYLCLAFPSDIQKAQIRFSAKLLDVSGKVVWEDSFKAHDWLFAWVYTPFRSPGFGEPAREAAEQLRLRLASARHTYAEALAAGSRAGPRAAPPARLQVTAASVASAAQRWAVHAGPKKRVAVLELGGRLEEGVLATLADRARGAALRAVAGYGMSVMTRESMAAVMKDMGVSVCTDGECEVEIGRNIGADLVVTGDVIKIEGQYLVTLKLHETAGGALVATAEQQGGTLLQLVEAVSTATDSLFR
jgi:hypothetical protein